MNKVSMNKGENIGGRRNWRENGRGTEEKIQRRRIEERRNEEVKKKKKKKKKKMGGKKEGEKKPMMNLNPGFSQLSKPVP